MTATLRYSILITDDDRGVRDALGEIVEEEGFRPVLASHGEEAVEIPQIRDVTLDGSNIPADFLNGLVQLRLTPSSNEYIGAFAHEPFGSGETDSAVPSRDDSYLPLEFSVHMVIAPH